MRLPCGSSLLASIRSPLARSGLAAFGEAVESLDPGLADNAARTGRRGRLFGHGEPPGERATPEGTHLVKYMIGRSGTLNLVVRAGILSYSGSPLLSFRVSPVSSNSTGERKGTVWVLPSGLV